MSSRFGKKGSTELFAKAMRAADYGTRKPKTRPVWSAGVTLGLVAVLGGVLWFGYPKDGAEKEAVVTPIVRADIKPFKIVPDDPGGMDIPYRESAVFETLKEAKVEEGAGDQNKIEQLLPAAEKPLERDEIFARLEAELNKDVPVEAKIIEKPKVTHEIIKPQISPEYLAKLEKEAEGKIVTPAKADDVVVVTKAVVEEPEIAMPAVKPVKISLVDPTTKEKTDPVVVQDTITHIAEKIAETEPASGGMLAEAVKVTGTYFVQLGSVPDASGVEKEWKRLQAAYSGSLSGLSHRVREANLGERGTYYRIQGGPVTEEMARSICDTITAKKPGGCLVIKP